MMFGSKQPAGQLADTRKEFLMLLRQMAAIGAGLSLPCVTAKVA